MVEFYLWWYESIFESVQVLWCKNRGLISLQNGVGFLFCCRVADHEDYVDVLSCIVYTKHEKAYYSLTS